MANKPTKHSDRHKRFSTPMKKERQERKKRHTILIVCEGTRTEPNYFEAFRDYIASPLVSIETVGPAMNTISLVREAINLEKAHEADEVWCVFDKDSFPDCDFDNAIKKAEAHQGIELAYSNEAFELWYLLHYDFHTSAISRHQYYPILSENLKEEYRKNSKDIFSKLKDRIDDALRNAKKRHKESLLEGPPSKNNPVTLVYLLVERLIEIKNSKAL